MYKEFTLREYKIFRKYFFYKEFLLLFKDKEKIKITTRKAKELTQILDELISRRSEKEDQ